MPIEAHAHPVPGESAVATAPTSSRGVIARMAPARTVIRYHRRLTLHRSPSAPSAFICVICGSYDVPPRRRRLLLCADRLDRRYVLGLVVEQLQPVFLGVALREDLVLFELDPHSLLD